MASSKVMATSRARNPDLPTATTATASSSAAAQPPPRSRSRSRSRRAPPSSSSAPHTPTKPQPVNLPNPLSSQSTMTVDGILRYSTPSAAAAESTLLEAQITLIENPTPPPAAIETMNSPSTDNLNSNYNNINGNNAAACNNQETVDSSVVSAKTVDDVWREIVAGRKEMKEEPLGGDEMMTLEDFLAKAGAVDDDDDDDDDNVKMESMHTERLSGGIYAFEPAPTPPAPPPHHHHHHHLVPMTSGGGFQVEGSVIGFGNGVEVVTGGSGGGGGGGGVGGRGKRGRGPLLEPMDKAAQQRQRRMIKNRESAARSRERKQAYQVELESLAVRLEEENELLMKEKEERAKERFKQLMEKVVPVVEKRRPPRVLCRVRSL